MRLKPAEILPITHTRGCFPTTPDNGPTTPDNESDNSLPPTGVTYGHNGLATPRGVGCAEIGNNEPSRRIARRAQRSGEMTDAATLRRLAWTEHSRDLVMFLRLMRAADAMEGRAK